MSRAPRVTLLLAVVALAGAAIRPSGAGARIGSPIPTRFAQGLDIPPRQQWNANSGYCGETSFLSAGLYFGQYTSQWTARAIASPGVAQSNPDSQLLLGVNDVAAARAMRLETVTFYDRTQRTVPSFFAWVKSNLLRGRPVIVGVLNNVRILGEPLPGYRTYDHIVPVIGVGSGRSLARHADRAFASDVLTFSDNGLFGAPGQTTPFVFSYRLWRLPKSRRAANRSDGAVYSLRDRPPNYAVAVTGVADLDGVTIPVRLTSDRDGEPEIPDPSDVPPAPVPITLTATVTIPDPSVGYRLYRYADFADVPAARFNASAALAAESWTIPPGGGAELVVRIPTMSDATVVLRAVPASAP
ncbi:MAG: hypothetical protein KIT14_06090 [bacterium]|nr:hypothetical protein [bacterium]